MYKYLSADSPDPLNVSHVVGFFFLKAVFYFQKTQLAFQMTIITLEVVLNVQR